MNAIGLVALVLLLPALLRPFLPARLGGRGPDLLVLAAVALLVADLVLRGPRFPLWPAYLLALVVAIVAIGRLRSAPAPGPRRLAGVVGGAIGLAVWLVAGALALLVPLRSLAPTGPRAVGTITWVWTDRARPESLTPEPGDFRTVVAQAWYPAEGRSGRSGRELPGTPPAIGGARLPVLLFSHGAMGMRTSNRTTCRDLASHGYVVVSVDHVLMNVVTVLPGRRLVPGSAVYREKLLRLMRGRDPAEHLRLGRELLDVRVADVRFVLDRLAELNAGKGPLAGRLDLARVGAFGHSMGAATAAEVTREDSRCAAVAAVDGTLTGEVVAYGPDSLPVIRSESFPRPLLLIASGSLFDDPATRAGYAANVATFERASEPAYNVVVAGAGHMNFTDLPLVIAPPVLGLLGERQARAGAIPPERCLRILDDYLLAFFDRHLRGRPAPLLEGPAPGYPEVRFERRGS